MSSFVVTTVPYGARQALGHQQYRDDEVPFPDIDKELCVKQHFLWKVL